MSINPTINLYPGIKFKDLPDISSVNDKSVKLDISPPFWLHGNVQIRNVSFKINEVDTRHINVSDVKAKIANMATDKEREAYFSQTFNVLVERKSNGFKVILADRKAPSLLPILDYAPGASLWRSDIHFVDSPNLERGTFLRWPADIESIDVSPDGKWIFFWWFSCRIIGSANMCTAL